MKSFCLGLLLMPILASAGYSATFQYDYTSAVFTDTTYSEAKCEVAIGGNPCLGPHDPNGQITGNLVFSEALAADTTYALTAGLGASVAPLVSYSFVTTGTNVSGDAASVKFDFHDFMITTNTNGEIVKWQIWAGFNGGPDHNYIIINSGQPTSSFYPEYDGAFSYVEFAYPGPGNCFGGGCFAGETRSATTSAPGTWTSPAAVPLPAALPILLVALGGLGFLRKRSS